MPNEDDRTPWFRRSSSPATRLMVLGLLLVTCATLAIHEGVPLLADEARCLYGCLRVIDAESRPVTEYAVSIVDGSDPFAEHFELPPGFPQPPRGTVVGSIIVRSSDGTHELSVPVDPGLRLDVFSVGYLTLSVAAPPPGEMITIRLPEAFALSGRVEGPAGSPLSGASVRLHRSDALSELERPPMVVTDTRGEFEISPLYESDYLLVISHPEFENLRTRISLSLPPERQSYRLRARGEHPSIPLAQPVPASASHGRPEQEAPTGVTGPVARIESPAHTATSLPVAIPESTLSDLDRAILQEVLRDVRRRVQDVIDDWENPEPWELLVLARTEPFDWMEMGAWQIGRNPFDAGPLPSRHDVERSDVPVVIARLIREAGLEPVALTDLPLERHLSRFPIAIDFVDHSRHGEQLGRLPVLVSTTLPAMNDARTEAIVFVRSSIFDFFQWVYNVEIRDGRPNITWVAEPVPSC